MKKLVWVITCICAFSIMFGVTAAGATSPPDSRSTWWNYNGTEKMTSESSLPINDTFGPVSCKVTAMRPHESGHNSGTIRARVQNDCPRAVVSNSTEAKLWEQRWWGYNVIAGPVYSNLRTTKTNAVAVSAGCRTNSIRVTGYGHYLSGNTHYRSSEVGNTHSVSC